MDKLITRLDTFFQQGFISSMSTILIAIIVALIFNHVAKNWIKKRWAESPRIALRIKSVLIWTIVLAIIFSQINALRSFATALLASGGIIALVIGLASQEAASSIINGAMILTYKPYVINDIVFVPEKNVRGKVIDITLRHTVLETLEKTTLIIPNTIMNQSMIENVSKITNQKANYLTMEIRYDSDIDMAIQIMQEISSKHPLCLDIRSMEEQEQGVPKIPVYCMEVKENAVSLRATVFSKNGDEGFVMISDLRKQVVQAFIEKDIHMPTPVVMIMNKD